MIVKFKFLPISPVKFTSYLLKIRSSIASNYILELQVGLNFKLVLINDYKIVKRRIVDKIRLSAIHEPFS